MRQVKAPKSLKTSMGESLVLIDASMKKGYYCYAFEEQKNLRLILNASQIEKNYKREKKVQSSVVDQEDMGCAIASFSMLSNIPLIRVKEAFIQSGWDPKFGADWSTTKKAARLLGFSSMIQHSFPHQRCLVGVPSINKPNYGHCLFFDGKQVLDPQMNNPKYLWYGPDWGPEEIGDYFITITPLSGS